MEWNGMEWHGMGEITVTFYFLSSRSFPASRCCFSGSLCRFRCLWIYLVLLALGVYVCVCVCVKEEKRREEKRRERESRGREGGGMRWVGGWMDGWMDG